MNHSPKYKVPSIRHPLKCFRVTLRTSQVIERNLLILKWIDHYFGLVGLVEHMEYVILKSMNRTCSEIVLSNMYKVNSCYLQVLRIMTFFHVCKIQCSNIFKSSEASQATKQLPSHRPIGVSCHTNSSSSSWRCQNYSLMPHSHYSQS